MDNKEELFGERVFNAWFGFTMKFATETYLYTRKVTILSLNLFKDVTKFYFGV